jgi:hypothetical protein
MRGRPGAPGAAPPGRAEFGGAIGNGGEARLGGVRTITGHPMDASFLEAAGPDAVIVATGRDPPGPVRIQGGAGDLGCLACPGDATVPGFHVVADFRPDWIGSGFARELAERAIA